MALGLIPLMPHTTYHLEHVQNSSDPTIFWIYGKIITRFGLLSIADNDESVNDILKVAHSGSLALLPTAPSSTFHLFGDNRNKMVMTPPSFWGKCPYDLGSSFRLEKYVSGISHEIICLVARKWVGGRRKLKRDEPKNLDLHGAMTRWRMGHHPGTTEQWHWRREISYGFRSRWLPSTWCKFPALTPPANSRVEFALLIRTFCVNGGLLGNSMRSSILHLYECGTKTESMRWHTSGLPIHPPIQLGF